MDLEARYEFLETIGTGSFATVYRARDRELGREVAIKQIHQQYLADPQQLDRYWQEAQLLASLQHPNIVTIFDIYRERGWLILELMQANLADRFAGRQMDLRALRTTLAHCLRALKYLHPRGIVHGDIKLGNLMIDARRRVKLGDFGLARRVSDDEGSLLKGTTKYMAPEVVSDEFGEVGPTSDLYSLGFAAYELMCGPNFESLFPGLSAFGRNKQVAWMMWHAAPDRRLPDIHRVLEGVPDDLAHVIQKLCEKDQSQRYQTADEALSDLNIDIKLVNKGDPSADVAETDGADETARKKRLLVVGGGFLVSLLLCAVLLFLPGGGSHQPAGAERTYGIVREVLPQQNLIVVEDLERGVPEEFEIGQRPRIYLRNDKRNILLRELQPGDRIEIEFAGGDRSRPVVNLTVARPETSRGRIASLDRNEARVVVAIEEGDIRERLPLRVPERATVLLNGKPDGLRNLREGDRVEVSHLEEIGGRGRVVERLAARRLTEAIGFVADIDPAGRRLTVGLGRGAGTPVLTLPLAENNTIKLRSDQAGGDRELQPGELNRDDRVRVWYDTEFHEIVVTRDARRISGTVIEQGVRPEQRELVVRLPDGKEFTVGVDPSLETAGDVTLGSDAVTLADLRPYDNVEITADEDQGERLRATSLFADRPSRPDRWAIVIGVERFYEHRSLTPLKHSIDDIHHVRDALRGRYAVAEDRLLVLRDETRDRMEAEIRSLLGHVRSQAQVVVYVSTHAYVGDDGRVYLAGKDFNIDRMPLTGLPLDWLVEQLEACSSPDKLLLLDCTHPGTGRDLDRQPSPPELLDKLQTPLRTTTIIASCSAGERGVALPDRNRGLFAHFVADGFGGRADRDRDLHITADELFEHLRTQMPTVTGEGGRRQTPWLVQPE